MCMTTGPKMNFTEGHLHWMNLIFRKSGKDQELLELEQRHKNKKLL